MKSWNLNKSNQTPIRFTNPELLAKRRLLGDGTIVPVDEAEDAEEESSSGRGSGKVLGSFSSSSCSSNVLPGMGGSKGRPDNFALAKARWNWLMSEAET
jgi:hypothetical protein